MLKRYFIPHEANEYKPHFLRPKSTLFLGALVLGIEALFLVYTSLILPGNNFLAEILSNVLVSQTNEHRITQNLPELSVNPVLERAAQEKAKDMATKAYFAHTSPEGLTPWYWFSKNGYDYSYAGENLAINFSDSKDVTDAWMNSPGHRANILNNHFTEIGIATAHGMYEGRETLFVVELFGKPAILPPPSITPPTSPVVKKPAAIVVAQKSVSPSTGTQEMFVAVKGAESRESAVAPAPTTQRVSQPQANVIENAIATPRRSVNTIYFGLGLLILIALLLTVFVEIRIQHPSLIASGVTLTLIISGVIALNHYLLISQATIF